MRNDEFNALIGPCFVPGPQQEGAIALFCSKLRPYLSVTLARLNPSGPELIEDAVQSAFIKFIEMFRSKRSSAPPSPVSLSLLQNIVLSMLCAAARDMYISTMNYSRA